MDFLFSLLLLQKILFITLGITTILLSKFLPVKFLLPNPTEYTVINMKKYIKSSKILLFTLGIYYVLCGILLFFIETFLLLMHTIPMMYSILYVYHIQKKYCKKN